jgi:hypothetical protein
MKAVLAKDYLELVGVVYGDSEQGMDTFIITLKDSSDTQHLCIIGCRPNYTEQIEKAFRRMIVVGLTQENKHEETKENDLATPPPDVPAGSDGEAAPI